MMATQAGSMLSTRGLARISAAHPKTVVGLWAIVVATSMFLAAVVLPGVLTTSSDFANDPEAKRGDDILQEAGLQPPLQAKEIVIVQSETLTVEDPAFAAMVNGLTQEIAGLGAEVVTSTFNYYAAGMPPAMVSHDGRTTFIPVFLEGEPDEWADDVGRVQAVVEEANGEDGFLVLITGDATLGTNFQEVAAEDLVKGESVGIAVAMVILLAVFGTLVSALIPVLLAVVSVIVALGLTAIVGQAYQLSFFVTNMITMMGLAVGIDYSLFIVSRFREELRRGRSRLDAVEIAGSTASRAVFFSGVTVVLALVGMLLVPTSIFRSLGTGAILVVIVTVAGALTLLPAVLAMLGTKVNRLRVRPAPSGAPDAPGGFWDWITHRVMGHPVVSFLAVSGLLIAAALPYLDIETGQGGVSTLPDELEAKRGFLILEEEFTAGATTEARVAVVGGAGSQAVADAVARLSAALESDAAFAPPFDYTVDAAGDVGKFQAPVVGDPNSDEAVAAVRRLRGDYVPAAFVGVPAELYVSGIIAFNIDFFDLTDAYTPIVFAFVLSWSFLLLLVVFRSIVIPAKAIIMNLLSVGAAYGLLVLVFQKGFAIDLFGFQRAEVVEAWIPLFLFSVLFGLSMDYHVFLLSRIREHYDVTHDNAASVAFGLRTTAGLITGAALIMVAVFGGFASGSLVSFQQMGFGLAVAVLIDATVIRSILVPASMKMLGTWNWYFPRFLDWVPRVGIEGHEEPVTAPAGGAD